MRLAEQIKFTRSNPCYVVAIRSWFDKINGNSYFTGRIWGSDEMVAIPFQYGHGHDSYLDAAMDALGLDYQEWNVQDYETKAGTFGVEYCEVARKKDLHNGGK